MFCRETLSIQFGLAIKIFWLVSSIQHYGYLRRVVVDLTFKAGFGTTGFLVLEVENL